MPLPALVLIGFSLIFQPSLGLSALKPYHDLDGIFERGHELKVKTRATGPQPLSVPPSEVFLGNDGPWSGFELRVGSPAQNVDVFVSTTGSETFVVVPGGCQPADPTTCPSDRGMIFDSSKSSTWDAKGNYTLSLETNLGLNSPYDVATYGLDDLTLGWQGSSTPTLHNQTIAGTTATDFWVGIFGISPYPTNLTDFNPDDSIPTYLQTLKTTNAVPSLSWGYTGGAQYRLKEALASLTFGGYDTSLFAPSGVSFDFAYNNNRDLSLWVQSIAYTNGSHSDVSLLPSNPGSFLSFIDSTAPAIWLPRSSCQAFEKAFGLVYNTTYGYYFVDDDLHNTLTTSNPNVTFTLSNTATSGPTVNITLPYTAFDKTLNYGIGLTNNLPSLTSQRYFPLQVAENETQYTLGKTFLQEAYIITDYERKNFSVNPRIWNQGAQQNLVPICSVNTSGCVSPMGSGPAPSNVVPTPKHSSGLGGGAIAGIVVGVIAFIAAAIAGTIWFWRHRKASNEAADAKATNTSWSGHNIPEEAQKTYQRTAEIDSSQVTEMHGSVAFPVQLADGTTVNQLGNVKMEYYGEDQQDEVHELPADMGMQRQGSRPFSRSRNSGSRRSRHDSTGQNSSVSELSEHSDVEIANEPRPTLSHRRKTSEQSKSSDVSDVTLQEGGQSPAPSSGIISPVTEPDMRHLSSEVPSSEGSPAL